MQENKLNTTYIRSPETFYEMLLSGKYHNYSWDFFTENVFQIAYTTKEGSFDTISNTGVILVA